MSHPPMQVINRIEELCTDDTYLVLMRHFAFSGEMCMVSEFKWPDSIPSGQRTYKTPSCLVRKSISSMFLIYENGNRINLLDANSDVDENDRLVLISGAIGVFSGAKNNLYAGFISAAANNAPERLNPNDLENHRTGYYDGTHIEIEWNSEGKRNIICDTYRLMDLIHSLDYILDEDFVVFSAN